MKIERNALVVACLLAGMASLSLAEGGAAAAPVHHKAAGAAHHDAAAAKDQTAKLSGTVDNVDTAANRLDVKAADGTTQTLTLSAQTKVMKAGKDATVADIMKGDKVTMLRYNKSTKEVRRVEIGS